MTEHTEKPARSRQRPPGTVVVGVMLLLIALVTVYAARQRPKPAAESTSDESPRPATVDDQSRREAAHVLACSSIDKMIDTPTVFDRVFRLEDADDGTSRLTTAALLNGRKVDVSAVLQWDAERQAWELLEAYIGGAAVPLSGKTDD